MSYDTIKSRNERSAKEWEQYQDWANNQQPTVGDVVYLHNPDSVLHGLPAKVVGLNAVAAELDFGCEIIVPGLAPLTQRIWRMPLCELKFTPPPKNSRRVRS